MIMNHSKILGKETVRLLNVLPLCLCDQVAGRLHVEVVRVGGGLEDNIAGGDEPDNNQDNEIQDRKFICMVRLIQHQSGTFSSVYWD